MPIREMHPFSVRFSDEERAVIDQAAEISGRSASRLVAHFALLAAQGILDAHPRPCRCHDDTEERPLEAVAQGVREDRAALEAQQTLAVA